MKNSDCTVVVASCDAYMDVEIPFIKLFRKYWRDCPFNVALLAETDRRADGEGYGEFDAVLAVGADGGRGAWCAMLREALSRISTPYVLLLMNDYFLVSEVDTGNMLRRLAQAKEYDAANLRLNPNPPGKKPWRDSGLLEVEKNTAYCVTCQTGIWNKRYLEGLLERNKSAWEFERYGSFMLDGEKRPLLVTETKEFPFVDAVHKGYWEPWGVKACRENGITVDFGKRTLPPFGVRVSEGLKSLIFHIVPSTLLVKFQNKFAIGAK